MANSAKLAKVAFERKPNGQDKKYYQLDSRIVAQISSETRNDAAEAAFSAAVSYCEAINGLKNGSASWAIVKLYYSSFYCLRSILYANNLIPFEAGKFLIFDCQENTFINGGASSHKWDWKSIRSVDRLNYWIFSEDSATAYKSLCNNRDDANYKKLFTDPDLPDCLTTSESDISKRIKTYREDQAFFYTYLDEHLTLAYPTKLIYSLDAILSSIIPALSAERKTHLKKRWLLKERCPFGD